jgi:K(+)-stimulated pyrophosphate-energized sodium pump
LNRRKRKMMFEPWLLAPLSAFVSILVGLYFYSYVNKQDSGSERMKEISNAIREGAAAFIRREYTTLAMFITVVAVLIGIFLPQPIWEDHNRLLNLQLPIAYMFGSFCSGMAGYLGLNIATKANAKVANAAQGGLNKAFPIGFRGGAVMGLSVVGVGMLGISVVFYLTGMEGTIPAVLAYSFGASSLSLFAKAGGGIFTKTADISADLVGKVELGIPEDDHETPQS